MGSAPRFSGERTNNQLQKYYTTIFCGCQHPIFIILYFRFVITDCQGWYLLPALLIYKLATVNNSDAGLNEKRLCLDIKVDTSVATRVVNTEIIRAGARSV